MPRLKDREKQIPGGLTFYEPALKWRPPPYSSFHTITQSLIQVRRANPFLAKQHHWSLDYATVADEVDRYNAAICKAHGWNQYIVDDPLPVMGGQAGPFSQAHSSSLRQSVGRVAAGVSVLADMFGDEGPIQDRDLAAKRALVCAGTTPENKCPMNDTGDWTRFFTVPAQAVIRKALGIVKDMDLTTPHDDKLNVCTACGCPLKGKIYARVPHILAHMADSDRATLPAHCWILTEKDDMPVP